jgi:hypothetical protein
MCGTSPIVELKPYKDYTGVAGWEVARWLRRQQDEGVTFDAIAKASAARGREAIDTTALSRIVGDREKGDRLGKNCPSVVSLNFVDRLTFAADGHLTLSGLRVICHPTASAARKLAQEELSLLSGWTARDVAARASILLAESEAHIALGDPRFVPKSLRVETPSSVMLAV